jgi:hypothetical protein
VHDVVHWRHHGKWNRHVSRTPPHRDAWAPPPKFYGRGIADDARQCHDTTGFKVSSRQPPTLGCALRDASRDQFLPSRCPPRFDFVPLLWLWLSLSRRDELMHETRG